MINISRNIKYIFTGDLNNHIKSIFFDGKERDLLRAQIARISHGTILSPSN
jgi:radial spoke head protein 4A